MKTQKEEILACLKRRKRMGITPFEAFERYGITRLADVVYNLREDGHKITTNMIEGTDRRGRKVKYAQYVLWKEKE